MTTRYIAIHNHKYGVTVTTFASEDDELCGLFMNLPESDVDIDDESELTQVDFAKRINLDFEPHKGETLELYVADNTDEPVDFSEFR